MSKFNCPSCAAELGKPLKYSKFIICEYCQSSIFLEDDAVRHAGTMSILSEEPSIIQLRRLFDYRGWSFTPVGRVRYDYGRGWWDEWWCYDDKGIAKWVSVDEGSIAIEETVEVDGEVPLFNDVNIGDKISLNILQPSNASKTKKITLIDREKFL